MRKEFGFHPIDAKDCLPPLQRPKFISRQEYFFMILLFPYYDRKNGSMRISEVDFFIMPNLLVTVHDGKIPELKQTVETAFKSNNGEKEKLMSGGPLSLLYDTVHRIYNSLFPMLTHIGDDLTEVNEKMFIARDEAMIQEISNMKLNIVAFRKALQPHKNVLKKLIAATPHLFPTGGHDVLYLESLRAKTKDIWDLLDNDHETVKALSETYDSLTSFRTNDVIKRLTIFSFTVFPLTLLAAIFGMNTVNMPLINQPYGFWIIMGLMAFGILCMILYFHKKKWL